MKGKIFNYFKISTNEFELFLCLSEPVLSECNNIIVLGIKESVDGILCSVDASYLYLLDGGIENIPEHFKNYMD